MSVVPGADENAVMGVLCDLVFHLSLVFVCFCFRHGDLDLHLAPVGLEPPDELFYLLRAQVHNFDTCRQCLSW